jgi:hypothetical protein
MLLSLSLAPTHVDDMTVPPHGCIGQCSLVQFFRMTWIGLTLKDARIMVIVRTAASNVAVESDAHSKIGTHIQINMIGTVSYICKLFYLLFDSLFLFVTASLIFRLTVCRLPGNHSMFNHSGITYPKDSRSSWWVLCNLQYWYLATHTHSPKIRISTLPLA